MVDIAERNKQKIELQRLQYNPCDRRLNLYPEDFRGSIWKEVLQCLGIDDCFGVTLAVMGIKEEQEEE